MIKSIPKIIEICSFTFEQIFKKHRESNPIHKLIKAEDIIVDFPTTFLKSVSVSYTNAAT